jgi:hypothetical protein
VLKARRPVAAFGYGDHLLLTALLVSGPLVIVALGSSRVIIAIATTEVGGSLSLAI